MMLVSNIQHIAKVLWSDGRGLVLVTIAAGWFLSLGVRMVYPALLPHMRSTYGMSLSTAGLLLTTLWFAYAIGQLPGGLLADWIGEGRILMISTLVSAGMIGLIVTARSIEVLFGATILFGLTTALYGVARFSSISHLYPEHDGTAIGVTLGAGDMGSALLPPAAGFIATVSVWQYGLGLAMPIFAITAVSLWVFVPTKTSEKTAAVNSLSVDTARYVLSRIAKPTILVMGVVQVLLYSVWQALTGFYPTYLIEIKGIPSTSATVLFGLFFALGIIVKPISGSLYDRFGPKKPLWTIIPVLILSLVALPLIDRFWVLVLLTIPLSCVLGYGTITLTYMTESFPLDMRNTGLGFLRTAYMGIGAMSPVLFGYLADRGYFDEGFFLLAGLAAIALLVSTKIPDYY
ncbi:MFS transporter [Halostagnicola kamekurae]|uniref:Sugar phosphate permease n=1 Tax=Halostagnicola kamekurae TaxID=619731 RepID=A0A1I6UNI5_9EURY|nr:MFS transporter [Halostagnicola kamekurae]SFT03036.1 Sugar phosphate permease [Halostagnicola kamekurae]